MTQVPPSLKERCRTTVDQLIKTCQDRAACSALRPLLTGIPDMQIRAMRYLPKSSPVHQDLLYLIAGLIAEYPCEQDITFSFGTSLQKLSTHSEVKTAGIERRLESLLQIDLDSLTQPLHSLIVQARGTKTPVDYATLLYHLRCWDDSRKWVQLAWAKDFWCPKAHENGQNPDQITVTDKQ
jgi:CRISPR type I-E-associated protein CasB/Cse2